MFENIEFQYTNFEGATKPVMTDKYLEKHGLLNLESELRTFYESQKEDVDFFIEGEGRTLFPGPISPSAKNALLYLQVFGVSSAGAKFFTRRKNYDSYLLLYTYEGQGRLEYEGEAYDLVPDSICLIDCQKPHYYYTVEPSWLHAVLHFNGHGAQYLFQQFFVDRAAVFETRHMNRFQNDLENILRVCQNGSHFFELETSHLLEALLLGVVKEKYRDYKSVPDYILYLRKYMEHNFSRQLSLDELAEFANVSKYHLAREFKRHTGFTINEYVIELRLNRAEMLLSTSDLAIGQISQICGFSNYSNFYKLFYKKKGTTPAKFRKGRDADGNHEDVPCAGMDG